MSSSSPTLVDRERAELADLLDELGPDSPTCCAGWRTAHLASHLVVRERRPDAMPGFGLGEIGLGAPLAAWSERQQERLRTSTSYTEVVARLRSGPPRWSPLAVPAVARLVNTAEFAVHHEDVRRAQPGWAPRELPRTSQDQLWAPATFFARRHRRGVLMRRSDVDGVEKRIGAARTTLTGEPLELLLWAAGREDVARVEVT